MSDELEIRSFAIEFREDQEDGFLEGIAVPVGQVVEIRSITGTFRERFEAGAIETEDHVWLYRDHKHPIGSIVAAEHRAEGFWIRAKVALSDLGKATLELLRSGALKSLSVGFVPIEHREEDGVRVITRARLREVSVVAKPAYSLASVLAVREDANPVREDNPPKGNPMSDNTDAADIAEVRSAVEELDRKFETFNTRTAEPVEETDNRSAGEVLRDIIAEHEPTLRAQEDLESRAYTGGLQADGINRPEYVANLIRIFDQSSGVLARVFSQGTLPEKGNEIEIAELDTNSLVVDRQVNEGDDLPMGQVKFKVRKFPVYTYGGGSELSRQAVERASISVYNTTIEGLALAAGVRKKAVLRASFNSVVTARTGIAANGGVVVLGSTLAASDAGRWEDALIDAALKFESVNLTPEALIVSTSVFKKLRSLTVSGERVFTVYSENASGSLNLTGLVGNLAGIPVFLDSGQTSDSAVFVNGRAIRQYDSALVNLSAEKIQNLTRQLVVYRYGAIADEMPFGIVPVKLAAS